MKEICSRLPGIRGLIYRLRELEKKYGGLSVRYEELEKKYEELSVRYEELKMKDCGLDYRIDDVYHQIFLNRNESLQHYYKLLPKEAYPQALKAWYFAKTGKKLDLEHPVTLNEKLQWMKLYGLAPECTQLADKYAVRKYIEKMLGREYLVPLLGVWDTFAEVDFDKLPNQFVLKTNHGSGMNVIVRDKSGFDRQAAEKRFQRWLDIDYAFYQGFELQYQGIPRKILALEYICSSEETLREYEVYCLNGKPAYVHDITDRFRTAKKAVFDTEWNRMPFTTGDFAVAEDVSKPKQLDKILEMSSILCKSFVFVRIDWFLTDNGSIKFGEMTFTPASGLIAWNPPEYDRIVGRQLRLPL